MSKSTYAKNCFIENREMFGDKHSQPEKFNLYNGLALLAEVIEELENDVKNIKVTVQRLKS